MSDKEIITLSDEHGAFEGFVTKDSGKREQFDSGMVRDTQEGKPRFDLVFDGPLTEAVLAMYAPEKVKLIQLFFNWYTAPDLRGAAEVIIELVKYEGGLFQFLSRCSELMKRGAVKYKERNWMQANGEAEFMRFRSSACRHFSQYIFGLTDEDHSAATWFNLNGAEYVRIKLAGN